MKKITPLLWEYVLCKCCHSSASSLMSICSLQRLTFYFYTDSWGVCFLTAKHMWGPCSKQNTTPFCMSPKRGSRFEMLPGFNQESHPDINSNEPTETELEWTGPMFLCLMWTTIVTLVLDWFRTLQMAVPKQAALLSIRAIWHRQCTCTQSTCFWQAQIVIKCVWQHDLKESIAWEHVFLCHVTWKRDSILERRVLGVTKCYLKDCWLSCLNILGVFLTNEILVDSVKLHSSTDNS